MYKHVHRVFLTLSKKVRNGVLLSTTGIVQNNFSMPISAASKISLNSFTYDITKRYYSEEHRNLDSEEHKNSDSEEDEDSDSESEDNSNHHLNPSVRVQQKIQAEAQEELDNLLANDPVLAKFQKVIELEIEISRQSGNKLPDKIKPTDWLYLIKTKTLNARRKFLEFNWLCETKEKNAKKKKKEFSSIRRQIREKELSEIEHLVYGLNHNTMFTRIYKTTISQVLNKKLINAIMFGEKLVIDCGFESAMNPKEISSCSKQIMYAFVVNREHKEPFDIHLCNLDPEGVLKKRILSFFPTMNDPGYPLNITSESYLEVFPKENLVYLTPDTQNVLTKYNPNDIYIIGGLVDKMSKRPLTMAKAKEEGLRVAKFPLDQYLDFKSGSRKTLAVNHCTKILLEFKRTKDWDQTLRSSVPPRKVIKQFTDYHHDVSEIIPKTSQNFQPKFQSSLASHASDATYYQRMSRKK